MFFPNDQVGRQIPGFPLDFPSQWLTSPRMFQAALAASDAALGKGIWEEHVQIMVTCYPHLFGVWVSREKCLEWILGSVFLLDHEWPSCWVGPLVISARQAVWEMATTRTGSGGIMRSSAQSGSVLRRRSEMKFPKALKYHVQWSSTLW